MIGSTEVGQRIYTARAGLCHFSNNRNSDCRYHDRGGEHDHGHLEPAWNAAGAVPCFLKDFHISFSYGIRTTSTQFTNLLILMASPRGFEPLLPP
jgi:hypothetical protein